MTEPTHDPIPSAAESAARKHPSQRPTRAFLEQRIVQLWAALAIASRERRRRYWQAFWTGAAIASVLFVAWIFLENNLGG